MWMRNWLISTWAAKPPPRGQSAADLNGHSPQSWSVKGEYMPIGLNDGSGFQTCGPVTTPSGAISCRRTFILPATLSPFADREDQV
jgi:hypothetical protein